MDQDSVMVFGVGGSENVIGTVMKNDGKFKFIYKPFFLYIDAFFI